MSRYPLASWRKAVALVRASRLYEQAVWIAEAAPELAWLLLVSAVEVAAAEIHGPIPRGRNRHPVGPTQRFVTFIRDFAPPPPPQRPQHGQLDWSAMEQHAKTILPLALARPPRRDPLPALDVLATARLQR